MSADKRPFADRVRRARDLAPSVLDLAERLVRAESPSCDEPGILEVTSILSAETERRGGRVEVVPAPGYGRHLIVDFGWDGAPAVPLLVVGHLDTVHPRGTLLRCPVRREGGRLYGPGIYDMKGSWAAALGALDLLSDEGLSPGALRFLVTCDEEVGAPDSRPMLEREGRLAHGALVLEPALPGGAIKVRRKGVARYSIRVRGRPAHAGVEPEQGASGIHELAWVILQALEAADTERGTMVNVGLVQGGTAVNVVAAEASAEVDVRFWTADEGRRVDRWLREIRPRDPRCTLELEGGVDRWAMEPSNADESLAARVLGSAASLGRTLGSGATGGASDGQILAAVGCAVVDGLGLDGGGAHTLQEHILLEGLPFRIAFYATLFASL